MQIVAQAVSGTAATAAATTWLLVTIAAPSAVTPVTENPSADVARALRLLKASFCDLVRSSFCRNASVAIQ